MTTQWPCWDVGVSSCNHQADCLVSYWWFMTVGDNIMLFMLGSLRQGIIKEPQTQFFSPSYIFMWPFAITRLTFYFTCALNLIWWLANIEKSMMSFMTPNSHWETRCHQPKSFSSAPFAYPLFVSIYPQVGCLRLQLRHASENRRSKEQLPCLRIQLIKSTIWGDGCGVVFITFCSLQAAVWTFCLPLHKKATIH